MEISKQSQTAGEGSTQIQAQYLVNINGIDEKRAREIYREEYAISRQNWTEEANEIADNRVRQFEDRLMPKMLQYDNSLKFFADPAFQYTLRKAQIAAASSERDDDYNLLSELLVNRVEQRFNRERRLGVVKAIEVVDQIDVKALIGLSLVYAFSKYTPVSRKLSDGLKTLDQFYGKIISRMFLPQGYSWMEHLELLMAIRIKDKGLHHFKKSEEYLPKHLSMYLEKGILADSEEYHKLQERFGPVGLNDSCFVPHPLKEGFLYWGTERRVDRIVFVKNVGSATVQEPLNYEQKAVVRDAIAMACKDGSDDLELRNAFLKEWDKYENLAKVRMWWDSLDGSFEITPVGVALSNAYIHGKDPSVPWLY